MENHPIENLMKTTMENLKEMIDVNTIVGDAVESKDGSLIIPISKVCFGFASGGSEFNSKCGGNTNSDKYPFGGGSGSGVSIKPVAFIVIKEDTIRLLNIDAENTLDKIVDSVPQTIDMIKGFFKNSSDKKNSDKKNNPPENHEQCEEDKDL